MDYPFRGWGSEIFSFDILQNHSKSVFLFEDLPFRNMDCSTVGKRVKIVEFKYIKILINI